MVAKHFGLDGPTSPNYVAMQGADANLFMKQLERIRKTASTIIKAIENKDARDN